MVNPSRFIICFKYFSKKISKFSTLRAFIFRPFIYTFYSFNFKEQRCYSSAAPPRYSAICVSTHAGKNVTPPTISNPRKAFSCNTKSYLKFDILWQSNEKKENWLTKQLNLYVDWSAFKKLFVRTAAGTLTRAGPEMADVRNWNPFVPARDFVRERTLRATNIFGKQGYWCTCLAERRTSQNGG